MRNTQYLTSRYRRGITARHVEPTPDKPEIAVRVALNALNKMGAIVSRHCFAHPEKLTEDQITAYALALLHLRECASAAGIERLANACDALAVTVARLIEDRGCACRQKCEAMTRFILHAKAMIQMSAEQVRYCVLPAPESHAPSQWRMPSAARAS